MYYHTKFEDFLLHIADRLELLAYDIQEYVKNRVSKRREGIKQIVVPEIAEIGDLTKQYFVNAEQFYHPKTVEFIMMNYNDSRKVYYHNIEKTAEVCHCNIEDLERIVEANS